MANSTRGAIYAVTRFLIVLLLVFSESDANDNEPGDMISEATATQAVHRRLPTELYSNTWRERARAGGGGQGRNKGGYLQTTYGERERNKGGYLNSGLLTTYGERERNKGGYLNSGLHTTYGERERNKGGYLNSGLQTTYAEYVEQMREKDQQVLQDTVPTVKPNLPTRPSPSRRKGNRFTSPARRFPVHCVRRGKSKAKRGKARSYSNSYDGRYGSKSRSYNGYGYSKGKGGKGKGRSNGYRSKGKGGKGKGHRGSKSKGSSNDNGAQGGGFLSDARYFRDVTRVTMPVRPGRVWRSRNRDRSQVDWVCYYGPAPRPARVPTIPMATLPPPSLFPTVSLAPSVSSLPSTSPTISLAPTVTTTSTPTAQATTGAPTLAATPGTEAGATRTQAPTGAGTPATTAGATPAVTAGATPAATTGATPAATVAATPAAMPDRMQRLASALSYGFFAGMEPTVAPTQDEINSLIQRTTPFYTNLFKTQYGDTFQMFELQLKDSTFTAGDVEPFKMDFDSVLTFFPNATEIPTPEQTFSLMSNTDYKSYITDYVWTEAGNTYFDSVQLAGFTGSVAR